MQYYWMLEVNKNIKKDIWIGSINIPVYDLCRYARNVLDYQSIIIVYCSEGVRSKKAVQILDRMGYKNLYNLKGGIDNWRTIEEGKWL